MKKKIIVACGGAVATSTVAANKIKELCNKAGIDAEIIQCRVSEIGANLNGVDLIVTTARVTKDYGVPLETGMAFITGIGQEALERKILSHLQ
ncbi:PTS galactitol transporter subunit IIB [Paenactinomyces guangxiensis]|uniref:PTS galactitol transporter subunit IIB n=1 Tax=Paenactinomyces guangxiensis TaxID=1490290 RepID=A0A7W1WUK8_9BACL|nr:PTS galactitol transporter subunit IIB [Paenactinomyces guangxiensis]MBA4496358.1 PTS galactitol transporter subunit IIB [Paenactinomyces guangxiensis]MBH8593609.1 PTS galactitol transporter subunit IIB [Paenactinomyces guangxiensis]